ncbi:hypothetical protein ACPA9J_03300 [Pseudomonas aeruginosa]
MQQAGIPEPGAAVQGRKPATVADEQALYDVRTVLRGTAALGGVLARLGNRCSWRTANRWPPSTSWCRWAPKAGNSGWLAHARDALENALQDSFD